MCHVVLLGCVASEGAEVIERALEVACCLDLLCLEHYLAVAIVESLRTKAVSRLGVWNQVRPSLCHKMEEISKGRLAHDAPSSAQFRAPRDASLEYWLLTRPYVGDRKLLEESLRIEAGEALGDVEERINQLEQLLGIDNGENRSALVSDKLYVTEVEESDAGLSDDLLLSETETDTSLSEGSCSIDGNNDPSGPDPIRHIAQQTRERVSRHLETIKRDIQIKSNENEAARTIESLSFLPTPPRLIDPLDQRTMFRVGANKGGSSSQRRSHATVTYPIDLIKVQRPKKNPHHKQPASRAQRDEVEIPIDAKGRWKKGGSKGKD